MKKNILVFPCGSEIGLEVYRSLEVSTHFTVYGGSSVDDHGKFVYKNYIGGLPHVDAPDFTDALNKIIKEYDIDCVIPAHDDVVLKLARESEAGNLACAVMTSPAATCEIARSKKKTYEKFEGVIPTPKLYASIEETEDAALPLFLKPEAGQGSKGTHIAKTRDEAAFYKKRDSSLLLMEYLPGREYTVDCFTDLNSQLLFCEGRERARISNGISVSSGYVNDGRFKELAEAISENLTFRGVWFFQVKETAAGKLVLMEIAPRVAGTMALARAKGVNLVLASLFDSFGLEVEIFSNEYDITIDRALQNSYQHNLTYSKVYLDLDDLVVLEGKVNPAVMAFVYQCVNKGVEVCLLTRHKADLDATLKKHRLQNTFDEVIWVKGDDEKFLYIKDKDAIFIDDSFAERKKVHEECGIPTFDGHMVEVLMEKF